MDRNGLGAVQNLGVVPEHRGRGLGKALMYKALDGFKRVGLSRAFLEVTCQNDAAIQLYRQLGFHKARTIYKVVEVAILERLALVPSLASPPCRGRTAGTMRLWAERMKR